MSAQNTAIDQLAEELKYFALESTSCGVVISDNQQDDNPLIYVNKGFELVTGYSREEIVGLNCRFLQGKDTEQPQLEILKHAIRSGTSCQVILKNYRKDGTMFYNELNISPIRNTEGLVTHFVGVQNDVTSREIAHRELAKHKTSKIAVKDYQEGSIRLLMPSQIIYVERDQRQVVIHTEEKSFPTYFTI